MVKFYKWLSYIIIAISVVGFLSIITGCLFGDANAIGFGVSLLLVKAAEQLLHKFKK